MRRTLAATAVLLALAGARPAHADDCAPGDTTCQLVQRVRAVDKRGSFDFLELVVTSATFSQLVDRVMVMQDIVRSDQRLVDALQQERDQINELEHRLEAQRADQSALLQRQRDEEA